jgi:hypothetical protein
MQVGNDKLKIEKAARRAARSLFNFQFSIFDFAGSAEGQE